MLPVITKRAIMLESSMNHYFEVKMEEIEAPFTAVGIGVIDNTCIGIRPLFLSPPPPANSKPDWVFF